MGLENEDCTPLLIPSSRSRMEWYTLNYLRLAEVGIFPVVPSIECPRCPSTYSVSLDKF